MPRLAKNDRTPSARAERRAIPGKGLTGNGYDGHAFWDTEGYVLPVLNYTHPAPAADALRWRASTLDLARQRAQELDLEGASFPWRTIRGQECSAYWPAGTAAWHVNGVTGPDEYTAVVRDNTFTNLMAADNLRVAAAACRRHPEAARALDVTTEEMAAWHDAADAAHIPFDEGLGVHQQCDGFTTLREWDFDDDTAHPLLLHQPYVRLYPAQVIKQADLVLAMHWQGHAFTPEQKARNVNYYEPRTVRDSSLSACTHAVLCAEVGHLELAHDYAHEAALIDLRDLHHDTRNGLHMASLAGAWTALVAGFGGLRDGEGFLVLDPQLPEELSHMRFRLHWRGFRVTVDVDHTEVTYTRATGQNGELTIRHAGEQLRLSTRAPSTVKLRRRQPAEPAPQPPKGREPTQRKR